MALVMTVGRTNFTKGDIAFAPYHVSASETNGIPIGYPVSIDGNGDFIKADQANALKADGYIYTGSRVDEFGAYNANPRTPRMPYGARESEPLGLLEEGVIYVTDDVGADVSLFRTVDSTITGTVATNGTTTVTGTGTAFDTELKVGDYIVIAGETVRQVKAIASATSLTVSVACSTTASGKAVTAKSQLNKPIYLGATSGTGAFTKLGLPYATLKPVTGDGLSQVVGKVLAKNIFKVNFNYDLAPASV